MHPAELALCLAGAVFLLAFFVWGSQNLGATSAGKRAAGLWGSVAAYSAMLSVARCGVQLAFAVGKPAWAGGGLSHEILELIGLARAPDALGIILVILKARISTSNTDHLKPASCDGCTQKNVCHLHCDQGHPRLAGLCDLGE